MMSFRTWGRICVCMSILRMASERPLGCLKALFPSILQDINPFETLQVPSEDLPAPTEALPAPSQTLSTPSQALPAPSQALSAPSEALYKSVLKRITQTSKKPVKIEFFFLQQMSIQCWRRHLRVKTANEITSEMRILRVENLYCLP